MAIQNKRAEQTGFTLIEALIAFVIFAVGILGALTFHAELTKETSDTKAQREAFTVAEAQLESLRSVYATTSSAYLAGLQSAIASVATPVSGINSSFDIAFVGPTSSGAPSLDDMYAVTVQVSWDKVSSDTADTETVSLTSYYSWIDPSKQLDEDEAGSGNSGYAGKFSPPTGNASSITRTISMLDAPVSTGYVSQSGAKVRVAIGDAVNGQSETVVDLIELNNENDPYVQIFGTIYEHDAKNDGDRKLGNSNSIRFDYLQTINSGASDSYYVVDVTASEGANCAVYYIGTDTQTNPKKDYAKYICVAGEGWNGTVQASIIEPTTRRTPDNASQQRTVCGTRTYKYLIVYEENNNEITDSTPVASLAVKGQSGLVNFDLGSISIDNYFWPNPFYLVSNEYNSTSGKNKGDVIDQNFVIDDSGSLDCETAATMNYQNYDYDNDLELDFDGFHSASAASLSAGSSASSDFLSIWPGVGTAASFAAESGPYSRYRDYGNVVLGYVPYGWSIEGKAYIDPTVFGEVEIVGQPEPLVSIVCEIAAGGGAAIPPFEEYDYQCTVPEGWFGYLIIRPVSNKIWSDSSDLTTYEGWATQSDGGDATETSVLDRDDNELTIPLIIAGATTVRTMGPCKVDDVGYWRYPYTEGISEFKTTPGPTFYFKGVDPYQPNDGDGNVDCGVEQFN